MKIRCIAVDDQYLALDLIKTYAHKIPFLDLLDTFNNALSALQYLKNNPVDLLFLDIHMKEFTGIQLLRSLNEPPPVIFTTAYEKYAVESYEMNVLDYLLKPISFERFVRAVDKAYNRNLNDQIGGSGKFQEITISDEKESFFFLKSGYSLERVAYNELLYIKGERDYLKIVTLKKSFLVLLKFNHFEELLPTDKFYRVHKSYIVALDKIQKIEGNLIYISATKIPIGNSYKHRFINSIRKRTIS